MRSRNIYRTLSYMSKRSRYPDGLPRSQIEKKFDADIISELISYGYIDEVIIGSVRITVRGRETLQLHVLTVVNVLTAICALVVAVVALFL